MALSQHNRTEVRRILTEYPRTSFREIGRRLGISGERVAQLAKAEGLTQPLTLPPANVATDSEHRESDHTILEPLRP